MKFGKFKKLALASALALTVGITASAAGCSIATDHPRAKITVQLVKNETDVQEFTLEYKLYRNMYPQTVKHFIELSKSGFYNDMIVHDYSAAEWVTGLYGYEGYSEYTSAINNGSFGDYFNKNSKDEEYIALFAKSALTASVYANTDFKVDKNGKIIYDKNGNATRIINKEYAIPTVMGEFYNNIKQEIKNGALTHKPGSLKMIYYNVASAEDDSLKYVYVTPTSDQIIQANAKSNSATSAFALQLTGGTSYRSDDYCVFGEVTDEDKLEDLIKAVSDWFADLSETEGDHSVEVNAEVPVYGPAANGESYERETADETFDAPKTAIVIKSVKITKN